MLSGEKQRIERQYNFCEICEWFAARCDLIFLLFDPYKLDISDEFKQVGAGGGRGALMVKARGEEGGMQVGGHDGFRVAAVQKNKSPPESTAVAMLGHDCNQI